MDGTETRPFFNASAEVLFFLVYYLCLKGEKEGGREGEREGGRGLECIVSYNNVLMGIQPLGGYMAH